jgi:L-galactose dehydrogenase
LQYRTLGKTGLRVSALGFGASSLGGGVFGDVEPSQALRTVHKALELGINFIDVSPFYGYTKAETVLGEALHGIPRQSYYLATKIGRYGDSDFDFSAKRVIASVGESLRRLKTDYVDLLQSHDIEYGNLDQIVNETIPVLRKIQQQGKTRFVGFTGYPLKIFSEILTRAEVDTILSYNHYTLNDTTLEGILPFLESKKVGIISAAPVSQGLLTNQGTPLWHPAPEKVKRACAEAAALCRREGSDISKLAMQFALGNPRIHTVVVGAADPDIITKDAKWIEQPIDQELLAKVQDILAGIANQTWLVGKPENN